MNNMRYYLPVREYGGKYFFEQAGDEYRIGYLYLDGQESHGATKMKTIKDFVNYYEGHRVGEDLSNMSIEIERAEAYFNSPLMKELSLYD